MDTELCSASRKKIVNTSRKTRTMQHHETSSRLEPQHAKVACATRRSPSDFAKRACRAPPVLLVAASTAAPLPTINLEGCTAWRPRLERAFEVPPLLSRLFSPEPIQSQETRKEPNDRRPVVSAGKLTRPFHNLSVSDKSWPSKAEFSTPCLQPQAYPKPQIPTQRRKEMPVVSPAYLTTVEHLAESTKNNDCRPPDQGYTVFLCPRLEVEQAWSPFPQSRHMGAIIEV